MSFKNWSAAQDVAGKVQADDKVEEAPTAAQPVAEPDKMPEGPPAQPAPATNT